MAKTQLITGVMLTATILAMAVVFTIVIVTSPHKEIAREILSIFLAMFTLVSMIVLIIFYIIFGKRGLLIHR